MFITEPQNIAIKRNALKFFTDTNLNSATNIEPHKMAWADVCKLSSVATREASNLAGVQAKFNEKGKESEDIQEAYEGLLEIVREAEREKDIRSQEGSREPREDKASKAVRAKRPEYAPASSENGELDAEAADLCPALAPEQRFSTWAQSRSRGQEYRGLSVGNYLRSMIVGGKNDTERRALSEGSDSAGGYTVPDVLSATLIDLARAASVVVRAGAQTVPLTSDQNNFAKLLTDPVPAWREEAGAVAESDPTFGLVQLVPRSLAVQTKISAELMEDSLNLATELPRVLAAAMAVELDRIALLGTGTSPEPRGIANTSGIGTFAQDAETIDYRNLSKARTAILTANQAPSAYVMHPRDEGRFVDLMDSNGNPLMVPPRIAEIPMLTTTSIPIDGGAGSDESTIIAGNFARLFVGIRSNIRVEVLKMDSYASNLQYTLLAHMRADVAVTHPGAFYTLTGVGQV